MKAKEYGQLIQKFLLNEENSLKKLLTALEDVAGDEEFLNWETEKKKKTNRLNILFYLSYNMRAFYIVKGVGSLIYALNFIP